MTKKEDTPNITYSVDSDSLTGGWAPSPENFSVSFWLDVKTDELIRRLKRTKKRPLLDHKNLGLTVNKIYLQRKKTYNEADYRIKCNYLKPEVIVSKIIRRYEKSGN